MTGGDYGASWKNANVDPSAGVPLMPYVIRCPRCAIPKGRIGKVRRVLCADCRSVVPKVEWSAWAA